VAADVSTLEEVGMSDFEAGPEVGRNGYLARSAVDSPERLAEPQPTVAPDYSPPVQPPIELSLEPPQPEPEPVFAVPAPPRTGDAEVDAAIAAVAEAMGSLL
jgi:hypothetical protein